MASGHRLYDTAGRGYLDFANGIAVTALGHAHPRVTAAIHAQVDRLIGPVHAMGFAEPTSSLARDAAGHVPDAARHRPLPELGLGGDRRRAQARTPGRPDGPGSSRSAAAFHGRTFGATSVTTSNINYRTGYEPLLPGVYFAPYPSAYEFGGDEEAATRRRAWRSCARCSTTVIAPSQVAAILIEPVQGEGGYYPAPPAFLRALRALCDEHGILLIADEVQSGYGRTGQMWAFEHAGIVPDVVAVAKAIANGLPLSAIVTRASCRSAGAAAPTDRRTAATPSRVRPGSPSSRRSATRTWSPTPPPEVAS